MSVNLSITHQTIKIGYVNVRGLSGPKWNAAVDWIKTRKHDILFIAETWFALEHIYRPHPYFIFTTPTPPMNPNSSRRTAGILCLAHPDLHARISHYHAPSPYAISISYLSHKISAVYFPPSLPDTQIPRVLAPLSNSTIVLGDFNFSIALPSSTRYTTTQSPRRDTVSSWCEQNTLVHYIPTIGPIPKLDHVYARSNTIVETYIHTPHSQLEFSTDHGSLTLHVPLAAEDRVQSAALELLVDKSAPIRFYLKHLHDPETCRSLTGCYEMLSDKIDDLLDEVEETFRNERTPMNQRQNLLDLVEAAWSGLVHDSSKMSLGTYEPNSAKETRDNLSEKIGSCQSSTAAIRMFKRAQRGGQPKLVAESREGSPLEEGMRIFRNVYRDENQGELHIPVLPNFIDELPAGLAAELTEVSISKIIRNYPRTKSCGPDGLHTLIYATLLDSKRFTNHVCRIYTLFAKTGLTPTVWNTSNTTLLAKEIDNQRRCPISKTRPVSLTCMARRYFESALLRYAQNEPWSLLHPAQAGFRRGYSTLSHILLSQEAASIPAPHRCDLQIFLDLSKAFDRIKHSELMTTILRRACGPHFNSLIYSLMINKCQSHLIVDGIRSVPFPRERGVFQGSLLAPLLFNFAMDILGENLDEALFGYEFLLPLFLLYADDIKLQLPGYNLVGSQICLDVCHKWALRFGLDFGMSKCGVIGLQANDALRIGGTPLERVDTYKYLGVETGAAGIKWDLYWGRVIAKTSGILRFLFARQTPSWSEGIKTALVKTFVLSVLKYGFGLYAQYLRLPNPRFNYIPALTEIHDQTLHLVFGMATPAVLLRKLGNLPTPTESLYLAAGSFTRHLTNLSERNPLRASMTKVAAEPTYFMTYTTRSLLLITRSHPLMRELDNFNRNRHPDHHLQIRTFAKNKLQSEWSAASVLASYIYGECLTPRGKLDASLFIPNQRLRRRAILWRSNKFVIRKYCTLCMVEVSRSHITTCIRDNNSALLENFIWEAFARECALRQRKFGIGDNFSLLDFLLNEMRYEEFQLITDWVLFNLEK